MPQKADLDQPEMTEQGFVALDEFPNCPECGGEHIVIGHKPNSGLQSLYCKSCGRNLTMLEPASAAIDEENRHYAAIGDRAWGTGSTEDEAIENLKENLDDDSFPVYDLWVSNRELSVSRYGTVSAGEGAQVILHHVGKKRIRE